MRDLKQQTDEDLVKLYKSGDEDAFSELYTRYEQKLKRLIYNYIPDADEISDIYHDVLMRVVKHIDSFDINKTFSSWIFQIAINCCKNRINKYVRDIKLLEREKFRVIEDEKGPLSPEETMLSKLDITEFSNAIESLGDKFKDVFKLRFHQNMKYSGIAEILKCSERTAKWRMEKAIEKISLYLKERDII